MKRACKKVWPYIIRQSYWTLFPVKRPSIWTKKGIEKMNAQQEILASIVNKTVLYYHANCSDGVTAAALAKWALTKVNLNDQVRCCPVQYTSDERVAVPVREEDAFELVTPDETVYFLDICTSKKNLQDMARHANRAIVLDHHETAKGIMPNGMHLVDGQPKILFQLLDEYSGAELSMIYFIEALAHQYRFAGYDTPEEFFGTSAATGRPLGRADMLRLTSDEGDEMLVCDRSFLDQYETVENGIPTTVSAYAPEWARWIHLARLVGDYDTWKFRNGDWARAGSGMVKNLISLGKETGKDPVDLLISTVASPSYLMTALEEAMGQVKFKAEAAKSMAQHARLMWFGDVKAMVVNCPADMASLVGEVVYTAHPDLPVVLYTLGVDKAGVFTAFVSFRSHKDGPDVSKLAKRYGGGGHVHAAGCSMSPHVLVSKTLSACAPD